MNNKELKQKIVEIMQQAFREPIPCTAERKIEHMADVLIAAGIGDVSELKKHRVIVEQSLVPTDDNCYILPNTSPIIKQIYSGEEVEQIAKERDKYKHRAEVAENELKLYKLAVKIWQERYSDIRCFNFNIALRQAEKELAEERKE